MPFTVITLTNVPPSLKGDLTKWMQEIATGVYIGQMNTRIRDELWKRVIENVGNGEATLSYRKWVITFKHTKQNEKLLIMRVCS